MRHRGIALFILAASLAWPPRAESQRPPARPNVVLIMMDDLGYGDLGSYGAPDARTPHIDRLAREGVRFTDAYANGAVCTPTRAALMTGRYQQRIGLEWMLTQTDTQAVLPLTGASLPALLKANGYATALVGKWHLGVRRGYGPRAHGFDEFFGFLEAAHDYYVGGLHDDTALVRPRRYLTDEITDRAVAFIARPRAKPFFLEVAYNAVHWPFQPPDRPPVDSTVRRTAQELRQSPADAAPPTRADYLSMLERADAGVGRILEALDRIGAARSTLVIFTNDNGGEWLSRNAPLFHRKGTLWEGGIRVPLIMRWQGALPGGTTSPQVALTMDITASILSATGTRPPTSHGLDGIDLLPMLRGDVPTVERTVFWRLPPYMLPGTLAPAPRRQRVVRAGRMKLMAEGNDFFLFDLDADPSERNDLAAQRPEVVRSLWALLQAWEREVDAERTGTGTPTR